MHFSWMYSLLFCVSSRLVIQKMFMKQLQDAIHGIMWWRYSDEHGVWPGDLCFGGNHLIFRYKATGVTLWIKNCSYSLSLTLNSVPSRSVGQPRLLFNALMYHLLYSETYSFFNCWRISRRPCLPQGFRCVAGLWCFSWVLCSGESRTGRASRLPSCEIIHIFASAPTSC